MASEKQVRCWIFISFMAFGLLLLFVMPDTNQGVTTTTTRINRPVGARVAMTVLVDLPHPPGSWNLTQARDGQYFSQQQQDRFVETLFGGKRNGIFVELGAYDGQTYSNTLYLERELNWTGLLIEPNPFTYAMLRSRRRSAYSSPACVSSHEKQAVFHIAGGLSGLNDSMSNDHRVRLVREARVYGNTQRWKGHGTTVSVNCFPLQEVFAAADIVHIDYLSLDTEGSEADILEGLPSTQLQNIVLIAVESNGELVKMKRVRRQLVDWNGFTELKPTKAFNTGEDVFFWNTMYSHSQF